MDVTPESVAKRLRQELLRRDIPSDTEAARQAGVKQQWLSRRLTGQTPWTLIDLQHVCGELDLSLDYVICGNRGEASIPVESLVKLLADHVSETSDPKAERAASARDTEAAAAKARRSKADVGKRIARAADTRKRR
ncbi:hypothetical protein [Mycolicibacter kumamotonensis]|uniref:hypothetical protein n=1 Tax=Mycolicibacter kumamotonensis TaxID=354243 RepID=UPI001055D0D8|nr:hypothetical protein [Mycolicibacter kumamotonensis]